MDGGCPSALGRGMESNARHAGETAMGWSAKGVADHAGIGSVAQFVNRLSGHFKERLHSPEEILQVVPRNHPQIRRFQVGETVQKPRVKSRAPSGAP